MKRYVFEYAADRIAEYYTAMADYAQDEVCETLANRCARYVAVINEATSDYLNGIIDTSYAMEKICNPSRFACDMED